MRTKLLAAAIAATVVVLPTAAIAAPAVLVVDTDRILAECTACKAAGTTLQGQVNAGRTRAQQLQTQWQTEQKALEAAVAALNGKQPDAALSQRVQRYQTSRQQGEAELAQKEQQIQSTQANVQRQIASRVVQLSEQARVRRQADLVVAKNSTLASNSAGDITAEVLAALNQQLPSVSVTPLPQHSRPRPDADRVTTDSASLAPLDVRRVMEALPHRYPMLLVDRVDRLEKDVSITAIKAVTINEQFFQGHFPGRPIMPGVFIVEALAQAAGVLAVESLGLAGSGKLVYFMAIDGAKFRTPVEPGCLLTLDVEFVQKRSSVCKFSGKATVNGKLAAEANFTAMIADPPQ